MGLSWYNTYMKNIFKAIEQLLIWQNKATIAQIAKIAERKQSIVLDCIINNKDLVIRKNGVITGWVNKTFWRNPTEKYYIECEENQGGPAHFECFPIGPCQDLIEKAYRFGHLYERVLNTNENKNELHKRGYIPLVDRKKIPLEEMWVEA